MSLKVQLEAHRRDFEANADPALVMAVRASIRHLSETGITSNAVKAGSIAPTFRLRDERGNFVALADLLARGPAALSFFRGEWCPYCALQLTALAEVAPDAERLGATLVALSPHARERSSPLGRNGKPAVLILRDPGAEIALQYRIAFMVPRQFRAPYLALGLLMPAKRRSKSWLVPIPATYVIDTSGLIVLSYLDTNHTNRPEPAEIIRALAQVAKASDRAIPGRNNR
jgi:peroxiredoxin